MSAFLWFVFVLEVIAVIVYAAYLCEGQYPRTKEATLGSDCVSLIVGIAMMAWAAYLLFR